MYIKRYHIYIYIYIYIYKEREIDRYRYLPEDIYNESVNRLLLI